MKTAFVFAAERTTFCTIQTSHQIYTDRVTYPLCLTLHYEEVRKRFHYGKTIKCMMLQCMTSADTTVKIMLQ